MSIPKHGAYAGVAALALVYTFGYSGLVSSEYRSEAFGAPEKFIPLPELDKADYNARLLALAHVAKVVLLKLDDVELDRRLRSLVHWYLGDGTHRSLPRKRRAGQEKQCERGDLCPHDPSCALAIWLFQ